MSLNPFAAAAELEANEKIGGEEKDSLGGGFLLPSGSYDMTINVFYAGKYDSGAGFVHMEATDAEGKKFVLRECTSNKAGENFYIDKDSGEKKFLPGYNKMNSIALLSSRKALGQGDWQTKVVKMRNKATGTDVPTDVPMNMSVVGKKVTLGILEVEVNKTQKNEATGKYDPIAETRVENQLDKVFDFESKKTIAEFRAKAETGTFHGDWVKKFSGEKQNRVKTTGLAAAKAGGGSAASGNAGPADGKPVDDLFS